MLNDQSKSEGGSDSDKSIEIELISNRLIGSGAIPNKTIVENSVIYMESQQNSTKHYSISSKAVTPNKNTNRTSLELSSNREI